MLLLRRVVGDSMLPALAADRLVVARRTRRSRPGDVVIVRHDGLEKIKRVAQVSDGQVFVLGDNPGHSTDSRSFGWLPQSAVVAKVVWPKTRVQG
ncbi:MAG TPA: nickel-type superoxide dismutase maturation protease [Candidatus Saccharimonadales bacterium]|nr:nickel-type superoxide dismutase maturation protease [Candidatus Saccharimonadales bacterium]